MKKCLLPILLSVLLPGAGALGAELAKLPANKWTVLHDGGGEVPIKGKLCWVPELNAVIVWPRTHTKPTQTGLFSLNERKWTIREGTVSERLSPLQLLSPKASVYLPGLKKILVAQQDYYYKQDKKIKVISWLVDPVTGAWEPLKSDLFMSDRSAEFNPSDGKNGTRVPQWLTVCYDPHNKEAVAFGGGGTWGRVAKVKSKVSPGDWIFDEKAKRCRRLTDEDKGKVTEARRWFPAHCGTWVFPESEKKWKAIKQPLGEQPPGRVLPEMAYDSVEKKMVLFGGDNETFVLGDTWIYDCRSRTWSQAKPKASPPARAGHAMVYDPESKQTVLAGGYSGGWKALADVWTYRIKEEQWSRLALDLPEPAAMASAAYVAEKKAILLGAVPYFGKRYYAKSKIYALRLKDAPTRKPSVDKTDPGAVYHCKNYVFKHQQTPLPGGWLAGKCAPEKSETVLARINALPPNTWKQLTPPRKAPARVWGSYVYDARRHRAYAYGGGHKGYNGAELSEYDLPTNRWRAMAHPTNYRPALLHWRVASAPGVTLSGWSHLPGHAMRAYNVDPLSDSVITTDGDVYSIKHRTFVSNIGRCPGSYQAGFQKYVVYCSTPHGLYGYYGRAKNDGQLHRANVSAGKWDLIAKGGPIHHYHDPMCYDSRRDRLVYFKYDGVNVWTFDFKAQKWSEEKAEGKAPKMVGGDPAYIPEMDAVVFVYSPSKAVEPQLYFYKIAERRWYTAPHAGDKVGLFRTINNSTGYDPKLKLLVRITSGSREAGVDVVVMRLDPKTLKLKGIK